MTGQRIRSGSAGFTLVEVLVATVVLALLMLSLQSVLQATGRAAARATADAADAGEIAAFDRLMDTLLLNARPALAVSGSGPPFSAGSMQFETLPPMSFERRDPLVVTLSVEADTAIVAAWRDPGSGDLLEETVLEGMAGVRFAYGAASDGPEPAGWSPVWTRTDRFPDLVAVTAGADGTGRPRRLLFARRIPPPDPCEPAATAACGGGDG